MRSPKMPPGVQLLESRTLLAAVLDGATLRVFGTPASDHIQITAESARIDVSIDSDSTSFASFTVSSIVVLCGDGDDLVTIGAGIKSVSIDGGLGNDTLFGSSYADTLIGGDGNDYLDGGARDDLLNGGPGDDRAYGQGGNDTFFGGEGKDYEYGGRGNDLIDGQAGQDFLYGGGDNDTLYGGGSNDRLYGESGDDALYGQKHNDILDGGGGADTLSGSSGIDIASYPQRAGEVIVTPQPLSDQDGNNDGEEAEHDFVVNDVEGTSISPVPTSLPDGNSSDDRAMLQQQIDTATSTHKPIVLKSGGHYRVSSSLNLKSGVEFTTDGGPATITANGAFPIFKAGSNVENVTFRNLMLAGTGATGIGSDGTHGLAWSLVDHCTFFTSLAWGVDTQAIGLTVRDCMFGSGDLSSNFRHVRIFGTSGGGGCNLNTFDGCRFFNAAGSNAMELSGGFRWTFRSCDFELNRVTNETIRFYGCRSINFNECWFEANRGEYEVRFVADPSSGAGTYGVSMQDNWFTRRLNTNRAIIGVENVFDPMSFISNNGNIGRPDGKAQYITDGIRGHDGDVGVYQNNSILGYSGGLDGRPG